MKLVICGNPIFKSYPFLKITEEGQQQHVSFAILHNLKYYVYKCSLGIVHSNKKVMHFACTTLLFSTLRTVVQIQAAAVPQFIQIHIVVIAYSSS